MRWPRMMRRKTAAEYVDLSESAFEREVAAGRLPSPVMLGGREHWSQLALDRALAILTGDEPLPEWEQDFLKRYGYLDTAESLDFCRIRRENRNALGQGFRNMAENEKPLDAGHIYKHHGWWPHEKPWEPDLTRCRHAVHDGGRSASFHQCDRKAKVFREANWHGKVETFGYCGTHDPVAVAQKRAKRDAEWQAKWKREQAAFAAKRAARDLAERAVEALRQIAAGHNDPRALAMEVLGEQA